MLKTAFLLILFAAICLLAGKSPAQTVVPVRLADVRSVYLDERSFNFTFSSCGTSAGGMVLPCPKHSIERLQFLDALKRWLEKSGFTLAADKDGAEGILQGTISIDDNFRRDDSTDRDKKHRRTGTKTREPEWWITAWVINQDGLRIWTLAADYPGISYKPSEKPKIEGKRIAKALEHDFKKKR